MNSIIVALLALNLLLLLWLSWRALSSSGVPAGLQSLFDELRGRAEEQRQRGEQMGRELRDELARSATAARQELSGSMALFQQTVLTQQGDATRTQNEQLDSFRVQLAATQQALTDSLRDAAYQQAQQSTSLREAQSQALARFNEAQEAAL